MNELIHTVLPALFNIGIPVLYLIAIVFGIMSLTGKKEETKVLYVWGLFQAILALLGTISGTVNYLIDIGTLDSRDIYPEFNYIVTANSMINLVLGIVGIILIWLYVKRAYRVNVVPLIVSFAVFILTPVVHIVLNRIFYDPNYENWYSKGIILSCVSILISLVVQVMYLVIFMKNRSKEENVPSMWLFQHLSVMGIIIRMLLVLGSLKFTGDGYDAFMLFISVLVAAIIPARNFYFFKRSR